MAVLTINQKIDSVNNFIKSVSDNRNSYYCFVGKADPWLDANGDIDDTAVIDANTSIAQIEQSVYQNMVFGKLLTNNDISFMTKRYNWSNGSVYARYDNNDPDLYSKNFYVINDTNDVYKCIYNGYGPNNPNGKPSLIKPTAKPTRGNFQTSDGYIWKYMFTCEPTAYLNFQTSNYIPVTPNNDVINNAVPGTIDNIVITNAGNNYQVYETGFLKTFVNNYVVELPSTSSPYDNYYTNSSIYLKTGFGAGQIRQISSYSGLNKLISVTPAFNYYYNLNLEDINGTFTIGELVTQLVTNLTYLYDQGYFNVGDTLIQSDSTVSGEILHANSSVFVIQNSTNTAFVPNYPIFNATDAGIKKDGKVDVLASNGYYIKSNTSTNFTTDYAVNQYIRVGDSANTNIRRIVSVNSSVIEVDYPFANNFTAANNYLISTAASVESITSHYSEGSIVYTNIDSAEIYYANVTPVDGTFIIGETLSVVDENNISQNANGTLSFANSSTLILSNVNGTINANLYVLGQTSETKAYISSLVSYPNITVETVYGGFLSGSRINVRYANGVPVANAKVVSTFSSPNELTEYVISPSVNIEGDGNGALAYCTVDLSSNNPSREITTISLINGGQGYTKANVYITSNTLYGSGASVEVQISPVAGHGSDAYTELGSIYCGISKKFDTAQNETYRLPTYGSYRSVGIIKNPKIEDVILNVNNFDITDLTLANATGSFEINEIVYQASSNAAGIIVYANSTYAQIKNTRGTFTANTTGDLVYGLSSDYSANCKVAETKYFSLSANLAAINDLTLGGSGQINQIISNTQIRMTEVVGSFAANDSIFEPSTNTYANVVSIYISNGTMDATSTFGQKFNQTARITLTSNTKSYEQFETVTQNTSFATGKLISTRDEIDLIYSTTANFTVGEVIYNRTTGSNAIVTFANTTAKYLKLTSVYTDGYDEIVNKPFNVGDTITNYSNTKSTTINTLYSVLVIGDVNFISGATTTPYSGIFTSDSSDYEIVGDVSGAVGYASLENSIKLPDLIRESGKVIYLENMSPFTKTANTTEQVKLVIKF